MSTPQSNVHVCNLFFYDLYGILLSGIGGANLRDPISLLLLATVATPLLPWKFAYRDNKPIYVTHNINIALPNVYKYYMCSKVNKSYKSL